MKHKPPATISIILTSILVLLLLFAASEAYARMAGYSLPWWTSDGGGGDSSDSNYRLNGTLGQPDAGFLSGGNYRLEGGFWGGTGKAIISVHVYLPLTTRP